METIKFVSKPREVEGVQVTSETLTDVAAWCNGEVVYDVPNKDDVIETFIRVEVKHPMNDKQTRAYLGDWVLKSETGFKVYTNRALRNSFYEKKVG